MAMGSRLRLSFSTMLSARPNVARGRPARAGELFAYQTIFAARLVLARASVNGNRTLRRAVQQTARRWRAKALCVAGAEHLDDETPTAGPLPGEVSDAVIAAHRSVE